MANVSVRVHYLDGLRGLAAILVIAAHVLSMTLPPLYYGAEGRDVLPWQAWFSTSPFFMFVNGTFAVYLLFTLSGFVIAASADGSRRGLVQTCVARLVRLSVPCGVSILIGGLVLNLCQPWLEQVATIVNHWWIRGQVGTPTLDVVLHEAAGQYYWTGYALSNGVLWTMQRELIGSLSIYVSFFLIRNFWLRLAGCAAAGIVIGDFNISAEFYLCFVGGVLVFLLRDYLPRAPAWLRWGTFLAALILMGRPYAAPPPHSFYDPIEHYSGPIWSYAWTLGSILLLASTLMISPLRQILGSKGATFVGRISFGLYLLHILILRSLLAFLYVSFGRFSRFDLLVSIILYSLVTVAAAFLFTLVVDEPTIRLASAIRRFQLRRPSGSRGSRALARENSRDDGEAKTASGAVAAGA